jgi:hypothetical protein
MPQGQAVFRDLTSQSIAHYEDMALYNYTDNNNLCAYQKMHHG